MKLYLLRHGETQENIDGIIQGWLDTQLNERGHKQAKEAAIKFEKPIVAIYSSDLKRCTQTALYFRQKYPQVPYFEDERLRERYFGDAQGNKKDAHNWDVSWLSDDKASIANVESLTNYFQRVELFLTQLKSSYKNTDSVIIVTHGGTINRILSQTESNYEYQQIENCKVIVTKLD